MSSLTKSSSPILELKGVCKAFGGVVTAENINLHLRGGEILGLIGPNGAGKTTLLNLISGIYDVDAGEVLFAGKPVTRAPAHARARMGLARTFQAPRFLQRSSIRDNMLLGADLAEKATFLRSFFSRTQKSFEDEVSGLLAIADIRLNWENDISSMPYGHKKLLEIVRALLTHPRIILVDEPAAGLNAREIERVVALLRHATDAMGVGVVLIEHAMDMVMNTCDRILVLNFGRMIATGAPEEVSSNPDVIEAYLGRRNRDAAN